MGEGKNAMARVAVTVSALMVLTTLAGADLIVKKPLSGKAGPEKLLIIINGAYVPNTDYVAGGEAIQAASPLKLWIAIPSFILNCPNPGEIGSKIDGAKSTVQKMNFTNMDSAKDVFISGHSLGGIMCQSTVAKGGIPEFKYPVLTLAGELDGLTRITRIGKEWQG